MLQAFYHEEVVNVGEDALRLVLNFRALDAIESETRRSFDDILAQITAPPPIVALGEPEPPSALPLSLMARVVWGLLRTHHPLVDIDQAMGLASGAAAPAIGVAMGALFEKGFPAATPQTEQAKPAHP